MVDTQREKRIRRPLNVFSPSDNNIRPTHYLLHFDSTDSYSIALFSSIKKITGDTAILNIHGKKTLATIIIAGTLATCENEQRKRTRESQQSFANDQDGNETEGIDLSPSSNRGGIITTFPLPKSQRTALTTDSILSLSGHDSSSSVAYSDASDEENYPPLDRTARSINSHGVNTKSTTSKRKRTQTRAPNKSAKRQRESILNNLDKNTERVNAFTDSVTINENNMKDILKQMENTLMVFQNSVTRSFQKIEKKIGCHLGSNLAQNSRLLDQYRAEQGGVFATEYMENGMNLLDTLAKDPIDYSRKTLKLLFSEEELKTHTLPPKRDHLRREPLDERRFNKLLEAVRIKFRLDPNRIQEFYNDVLKTKLSNFLYEERRRETRRRLRDQERVLKQNIFPVNRYDHKRSSDEEEETNR